MNFGSYLLSIFILLYSPFTNAANIQNLESLTLAAEAHVSSTLQFHTQANRRVVIKASRVDPRLRLVSCDNRLDTFTPPGSRLSGNTTVGVRCSSPKPWSIYIPVKISIFEKAFVAAKNMNRGHIIANSDIILEEVDISRVRGQAFTHKDGILGTKLKKAVTKNQIIDTASICLICKGDSVIITVNNNAVSVSMAGIALSDGGKGDKIRVQNNASKRIVSAKITDSGAVSIDI